MRHARIRPWRRLASLRAGRRRRTESLPANSVHTVSDLPPLEPPDDDREFAPRPAGTVRDPRPLV